MTTTRIPVSLYSARLVKPTQKYGTPAELPLKEGDARAFAQLSLDRVPLDGAISESVS